MSEPSSTPRFLEIPEHWKSELLIRPGSLILPPRGAKKDSAQAEDTKEPQGPETIRILVAEDDTVSRRVLATHLLNWGYEPTLTHDGFEAMAVMRADDAPEIAILDWMMPGIDGVEVCRRVRSLNKRAYIIMLTALREKENIADALKAGADDYVVKPWEPVELAARIQVGLRILALQSALMDKVKEVEKTVSRLQAQSGSGVPI